MTDPIDIEESRLVCEMVPGLPWSINIGRPVDSKEFSPTQAQSLLDFFVHARAAFPRALDELEAALKRVEELEGESND